MLILDLMLLLLSAIMTAYLVRHYIFTLTALYYRHGQRHYKPYSVIYQPSVSVLIPAHNEERVIGRVLQRMTELTYPKDRFEVVVIDDGSTDRTGSIAERFGKEHAYIKVIHRDVKIGGKGKAAALNEGLKHATGEILCLFDADYYPQKEILEKLTPYFVNPKVGAVQGRVTVLNEPDTMVTRIAALERIGGYRVDQLARDDLRLIPLLGGTGAAIRRRLIESLGGWDPDILAEDTDLTFQIYLAGYKVRYVNEAEVYEEAVVDWRWYRQQRYRWAKGHMQCAFKHFWPLLKSNNLTLREKIDGLFLLNVYFLPILIGFAWLLGAVFYFIEPTWSTNVFWAFIPIFAYSAVGNFAPSFEVGIGAYLDQRVKVFRLIPLLLLTFVYNVLICTKALADLCLSKLVGKKQHVWIRTPHKG
ncbi:MAG: glycosyltransferase [Candidatus Bathyarchaeia archaeon]